MILRLTIRRAAYKSALRFRVVPNPESFFVLCKPQANRIARFQQGKHRVAAHITKRRPHALCRRTAERTKRGRLLFLIALTAFHISESVLSSTFFNLLTIFLLGIFIFRQRKNSKPLWFTLFLKLFYSIRQTEIFYCNIMESSISSSSSTPVAEKPIFIYSLTAI